MLTDTNFWIDVSDELNRRTIGPARTFLAQPRAATFKVSLISWGELAAGFGLVAATGESSLFADASCVGGRKNRSRVGAKGRQIGRERQLDRGHGQNVGASIGDARFSIQPRATIEGDELLVVKVVAVRAPSRGRVASQREATYLNQRSRMERARERRCCSRLAAS